VNQQRSGHLYIRLFRRSKEKSIDEWGRGRQTDRKTADKKASQQQQQHKKKQEKNITPHQTDPTCSENDPRFRNGSIDDMMIDNSY
jgi:hypothetical protein